MRSPNPGSAPVIVAQGLSKTYDFYRQPPGLSGALRSLVHRELSSVQAVDGVDLSVESGEIIGLDVEAKLVVRSLFRDVNQAFGTTIVLTSHDMDDVGALTERVVIVTGGKAVFDGSLSALRARTGLPEEAHLDEVMARAFHQTDDQL
jgi:ABC-2 type transport system ATP-binding protein